MEDKADSGLPATGSGRPSFRDVDSSSELRYDVVGSTGYLALMDRTSPTANAPSAFCAEATGY